MQRDDITKCIVCNKNPIQSKIKKMCGECTFKKNHEGKSKAQIYTERKKVKRPKATGERDLFLEIWGERSHFCSNCKVSLGSEPKTYMFSHIIAKSIDKDKRLDKSNIQLLCFDCHFALDHQSKEIYEKRSR